MVLVMSASKQFASLYIAGVFVVMLGLYIVHRTFERRPDTRTHGDSLSQWPREVSSGSTRASISNDNPTNEKSYMLTMRIPEQMTMSSIHFHQFLNLVDDWNFIGVEPFAYSASSTLYGLRSLHKEDPNGSLPYSKLFNSSLQNRYMSECMKRDPSRPPLFVPMVDFLRNSYRKLVLVYFASHAASQVVPYYVSKNVDAAVNGQNETFTDCTSIAKTHGMFSSIEGLLLKEEQLERSYPSMEDLPRLSDEPSQRFRVVQAFCIKRDIRISLRDLKTFVLDRVGAHRSTNGANEFSLAFVSWQGHFTHPLVSSDVKNYINNCRIPFGRPFYSDYVINAAKKYINSLNFHGEPFLSIHIRFEKVYEYVKSKGIPVDRYVDCCMKRLNSALFAVMKRFNISEGNALLNWDYSPLGTTVCPIRRCREIADTSIKKVAVKPSYLDPKKFSLPDHRGLISLVEMNALHGGKALVTVGDGSYQYTIIKTFVAIHQEQLEALSPAAERNDSSRKAQLLQYSHLCFPGREDIHELTDKLEPTC